jgi:hypothetical protein
MKTKSKLHILCFQAQNGQILGVVSSTNYDSLLIQAMNAMRIDKSINYWTIFDSIGRYIDGNFPTQEAVNVTK